MSVTALSLFLAIGIVANEDDALAKQRIESASLLLTRIQKGTAARAARVIVQVTDEVEAEIATSVLTQKIKGCKVLKTSHYSLVDVENKPFPSVNVLLSCKGDKWTDTLYFDFSSQGVVKVRYHDLPVILMPARPKSESGKS